MATGQYTSAPPLDHRTRTVAAVRLRRRPPRGRPPGRAVSGVAGLEPIPGRDCLAGPHRTQCFRRARPDLPHRRWRPDLLLTDNEKTVTTGHIAGVPVRNRAAVTFGRYY